MNSQTYCGRADGAALTVAPPIDNLKWFEMAAQLTDKPPLSLSLSQATWVEASVADSVQIVTRIAGDGNPDAAAPGEAI